MDPTKLLEDIRGKSVSDINDGVPDEVRSKSPDDLHQLIDICDAHLRSLHQEDTGEIRSLTPTESLAFDYLIEVRNAAMKKIEEHRALSEVFARRPASVKTAYANLRSGLNDHAGALRLTNTEARDMALRTLDDRSASSHLASDQKEQVERQIRRNPETARRILITENDAYRSAWMKVITSPNGAMLLDDEERTAMRAYEEYRAASETNASGGFAVPVFIDPSIIMTSQGTNNPFLQIAKQIDVQTNAWKGVSSAGMTWSFDSEAAEVSDDSVTIAQPSVSVFMARGFIPYSIEVGQDWPGFAAEMSNLLQEGYDELLIDKFTRGSGTGEPQGVLTALSAAAGCRVGIQTSGSAFGANDPYAVWKSLTQRFRHRASWLMSVDVNNKLRQLGTANVYHASTVSLPTEWLDVLFGKATYESPYMPDTTTSTSANTGLAIVGDFMNGYTIARRSGMSVELIPMLFNTANNLPSGQRGWFAYSRIGGGVVNTSAFRLLVNTA